MVRPGLRQGQRIEAGPPRKASSQGRRARTANRHRWAGEYTKVDGRTLVKELGKLAP